MHRRLLSVAVMLLACCGTPFAATPAQPATEALIASPGSLSDLTARCRIIAEVEVVDSYTTHRHTRVSDEEFIAVHARVISTIKGDVQPGASITFLERPLTAADGGGGSSRPVGPTQTFTTGGVYVMFLNWNDALSSLVAYGPDGTFHVVQGRIHASGLSEVARAQEGRPTDSFLREIRGYAARPEKVR